MRVEAIKPKLELPGTKRLKLKCGVLLSNFAFNFNLRRYTMEELMTASTLTSTFEAGAYTRSLFGSTLALFEG